MRRTVALTALALTMLMSASVQAQQQSHLLIIKIGRAHV